MAHRSPQSLVVRGCARLLVGTLVKCPYCDCHDTRVIDSRESADPALRGTASRDRDGRGADAIRRRRQCVACMKRFTTYERWERPELRVVKRDGRVEDFDREKLELGVLRACQKRPIGREAIGQMLDQIEESLRAEDRSEVPTTEIGALVLEGLKQLDQVAYLRFASVYKAFDDATHFEKELKQLRQETLTLDGAWAAPSPSRKRGTKE